MSLHKRYRYAMAALFVVAAIVVFVKAQASGTYFSLAYTFVLLPLLAAGFGYNVWYQYERRMGLNIVLASMAVILVTPVFR